jgi:hypothetical protein
VDLSVAAERVSCVQRAAWAVLVVSIACAAAEPEGVPDEFRELARQINASKTWNLERLRAETLRQDALIMPSDRTPVDIVWRRTRALAEHLRAAFAVANLESELRALRGGACGKSPAQKSTTILS